MNSKLCKKLRRDAEFRTGNTPTIYYNTVVNKEKLPTGELDSKGEPQFHIVDKIKTVMGNCTRKVYKQLKKEENRVL